MGADMQDARYEAVICTLLCVYKGVHMTDMGHMTYMGAGVPDAGQEAGRAQVVVLSFSSKLDPASPFKDWISVKGLEVL